MSVIRSGYRLWFPAFCLALCGFVYGCGSSSSGGGEPAAEGSKELHATVFEKQMSELKPKEEEVEVDVGKGHEISFKKGEGLKVAFVGFGKGFDYTVPEYEAAEKEAKSLGIDATSFDPEGDPQLQLNEVQTIMNSGKYNALVVYPLETDLMCDVLTEQAPAKNIMVVTIGYPACEGKEGSEGILTEIPDTVPQKTTFEAWAEGVVEAAAGEPQKAIILRGPGYDVNSNEFETYFEPLAKKANIEVVDSVQTDFTQPGALQSLQDALQSNANATMVISTFPEGTAASITALEASGKDDVILTGYGANATAIPGFESGVLKMAIPFYPYTDVKAAYQALILARNGVELEKFYPNAGHAPEAMRKSGDKVLVVTPDNYKQYAEDVQEY